MRWDCVYWIEKEREKERKKERKREREGDYKRRHNCKAKLCSVEKKKTIKLEKIFFWGSKKE